MPFAEFEEHPAGRSNQSFAMDEMRIDKCDWRVTCDGRNALRGEVGKDLVKLPVYEIEKQLLLSGAAG
jgi:hypothetical protein